ncbi:MAG: hypothetical protein JW772_01375 [Candidatus Diapherotrites archaeon]|nr:hypothetical protein [Candidatus Diapherotrites archaeon]
MDEPDKMEKKQEQPVETTAKEQPGTNNAREQAKGKALEEHPKTTQAKTMEEEKKVGAKEQKDKDKKEKIDFKKIVAHPAFVTAIFAVIIVAGVFAILSMHTPMQLSVLDFENADTEPVSTDVIPKVIVLISKECPNCESNNSFLTLLTQNNIEFLMERVDIDSEDGQKIVKSFGIKRVPMVLLDEKSIGDSIIVNTKSGMQPLTEVLEDYALYEQIYKKGDIYIIPEIELDNRAHVEMFLDVNSCGSEDVVRVDLFDDPYCAPCAKAAATISSVEKDFGENIEVHYNFLPIDSRQMLFTWDQIIPFPNYAICMQRQGQLELFRSVVYAYYCNPDQNVLDANSLENCENSSAFHFPIPEDRLKQAFDLTPIDKTDFAQCLTAIENEKPEMITTAHSYDIRGVPTVLVNCKYVTHAENIGQAICSANPLLEQCRRA